MESREKKRLNLVVNPLGHLHPEARLTCEHSRMDHKEKWDSEKEDKGWLEDWNRRRHMAVAQVLCYVTYAVYLRAEVFAELMNMGFEQKTFYSAYVYLMEDDIRVRAFFGCPVEERKNFLLQMMHAPPGFIRNSHHV